MTDVTDWFKDMDFWRNVSPMFNWQEASVEVDLGLSLLQLSQGKSILDLPCGLGRHSLEFARRGFSVTAVDLMPFYIEEGQRRAKAEGLQIDFIQDDMRSFIRPNAFDVVWNFGSSFGFFRNREDDTSVILNAYQSLRKGGKLLIEMINREYVIDFWKYRDQIKHPPIEGITLTEKGRIYNDESQMLLRWLFDKDGDTKEFNLSLRLYSASEVKSILIKNNFTFADFYGDISGSRHTSKSKRMVVIAGK